MKVRLEIKRGTATREEEYDGLKWSGEPYLGHQRLLMSSLPPQTKIITKRGTSVTKASEYMPAVLKSPMHKIVISTCRGTSTRIL